MISSAGISVVVIEKRRNPGRKVLIAGSSGLNVSNSLPVSEFTRHYSGPVDCWSQPIHEFPPSAWLEYIHGLGHETFLGTSGRYFLKEMKAGKFVRSWKRRLEKNQVGWMFGAECVGLERNEGSTWTLKTLVDDVVVETQFDAVVFALGGASYEPQEEPLRWPVVFTSHGIVVEDFHPSNVGYKVNWSPEILKECEGQPLKNIALTTTRGSRQGEIVITSYGVEGTPVYFLGAPGLATLDLKPDLTVNQIIARCNAVKENLAPIRRVGKQLKLGRAAHALLFHSAPKEVKDDLQKIAEYIKNFPLQMIGPQPLAEAISSIGGLDARELDVNFMIKRLPGVFAVGEMLNWDAPTGGFLLQACAAQGFSVGHSVLTWLKARSGNP